MKILRFILLNCWVIILPLSSQAQSRAYLLEEADTYFKAGRYWDAFFRYQECAKLPEFDSATQIAAQIKNSSHALYLTQKFKDYAALKKYEPAKENLIELIDLNANDPNRGQLAHITLAQGAELQRLAWRQTTPTATADMLKRAMAYYYQAAKEGLMEESITAIRQCEASLKDTKVPIEESQMLNTEQIKTRIEASDTPSVAHPRRPGLAPEVIIIPMKKDNN
jgi:tetratricopeptide (TPR) repeat protein